MSKNSKGVIYILTNPSFKEYVKIGYADDLESRLRQLNRSETIPYAFRAYAVYEVGERLTDIKVHQLIDKLNPNLRTIDEFDGKKRTKEFYAMTAEEAYDIFECIAEISGTKEKLKRMKPEGHEVLDEKEAEEIRNDSIRGPFRFSDVGIPFGATITFYKDDKITAKVVDDRHIEYAGEVTSLSAVASILTGIVHCAGPKYFKYKGKFLSDIRDEKERRK